MLLVPNSIPEGCYDFPTRNISILLFGFSAIHVKFFFWICGGQLPQKGLRLGTQHSNPPAPTEAISAY